MKKFGIAISLVLGLLLVFGSAASVQANPASATQDFELKVDSGHGTSMTGGSTIHLGTVVATQPRPVYLTKYTAVKVDDYSAHTKFESLFRWKNLTFTPAGSMSTTGFGYNDLALRIPTKATFNSGIYWTGAKYGRSAAGYTTLPWNTWVWGDSHAVDNLKLIFANSTHPAHGLTGIGAKYDIDVKAKIESDATPGKYEVDMVHILNAWL